MSAFGWVAIIIMATVLGWAVMLGFADAMLRRRHDDMLELRRWQETVEAMRRMADQEGDA